LVLLVLRMVGVIDSPWWVIFMPLWAPFVFFSVTVIVAFTVEMRRMRNAPRNRS
jgi:hypothetical protein